MALIGYIMVKRKGEKDVFDDFGADHEFSILEVGPSSGKVNYMVLDYRDPIGNESYTIDIVLSSYGKERTYKVEFKEFDIQLEVPIHERYAKMPDDFAEKMIEEVTKEVNDAFSKFYEL